MFLDQKRPMKQLEYKTQDSGYAVQLFRPQAELGEAVNKLTIVSYGPHGTNDDEPQLFDDVIPSSELEVGRLIGEGAFGNVYWGELYGQAVTVKKFEVSDEKVKEDIMNEVRVMRTLRHPNIVEYLGVVNFNGALGLVTERVEGGTLGELTESLSRRGKKIRIKKCIKYLRDIVRGLSWLHLRGIIHRDLKPSNILLDEAHRKCKVADFGLAHVKTTNREFGNFGMMGNKCYAAPEVLQKKPYGVMADMFSVAMVATEMLEGDYPLAMSALEGANHFVKEIIRGTRPNMPQRAPLALQTLLKSCWETEPQARASAKTSFRILNHISNELDAKGDDNPREDIEEILDSLGRRARLAFEEQTRYNTMLQSKLKEQNEAVIKAQSEAMTLDAELRVLKAMGAFVDRESGLPALVVPVGHNEKQQYNACLETKGSKTPGGCGAGCVAAPGCSAESTGCHTPQCQTCSIM
mmetsp:Transcript_31197/g.58144  ORF Transcript_31197/g.58144 Transcript_31197/m.58144 type:complete len:465 (-) Transcript_31197:238-1632(-)